MSKHDYAISVLKQKIFFFQGKFKKHPYHKNNSVWLKQIAQLESAIKRLKEEG